MKDRQACPQYAGEISRYGRAISCEGLDSEARPELTKDQNGIMESEHYGPRVAGLLLRGLGYALFSGTKKL